MTEAALSSPRHLSLGGWWRVLRRTGPRWSSDHIGLISGGIAFFGMLALFPAITSVIAVAGLLTDKAALIAQIQSYGDVLPEGAAGIILDQARQVASADQGSLSFGAVVGLLIALFSASRGTSGMVEGLNLAFGKPETRGIIRLTVENFLLTVGLIIGLVFAFAAIVAVPTVLAFLPTTRFTALVVSLLRWPLLLGLAVGGISVLYRHGPAHRPPAWRWITPGAIAATVLWLIGTIGFAIYAGNFASYNQTFGALAGVVILLMWLWLSAIAVLMGAELDSEISREATPA